MSKYEFTPGPWEAIRKYGSQEGLYVKQVGGKKLFLVKHTFDGLEAGANVKLMAAAPYMYEACKSMLTALNGLPGGLPDSTFTEPYFRMREALAKAGG